MIEYKRDRDKVPTQVNQLLAPVIQEFRTLDLHLATQGVIHGDIQRKHVIKNTAGNFCLIDFGVARYDALMYELSTFIAWFCLDEHRWPQRHEIIHSVLHQYTKVHQLSPQELQFLPLLIKAAYATYYFRTAVLISEGDTSQETKVWHTLAQTMLTLCQEL